MTVSDALVLGNSNLELVTSPTLKWLEKNLRVCKTKLLVASPYVNGALLELLNAAPAGVQTSLVTRTDLRDFVTGASSLDALCTLAGKGVRVSSLIGLHAKVYVFDEACALITSANATWSGMRRNWECGVAICDARSASRISSLVLSGLGADEPPALRGLDELALLRKPVEALRAAWPSIPRLKVHKVPEGPVPEPVRLARMSVFLKGFGGWTRLVLEGVLSLPEDEFSLNAVYQACSIRAARRYPGNKHVHDKIRQQLQQLRDLGLVEFLGAGHYRRTVSP